MKGKKKLGNVTLKDLEVILQSKQGLSIDQNKHSEHLNNVLSTISLSEILISIPRILELNFINDLIMQWTGKNRDSLENLSVKDIELIIKKAIESKQYDIAANFTRVYYKIVKYLRD